METTPQNIIRPINPELEEIRLKRRGQTFWARCAAVVTGIFSSYAIGSILTERALLKRLHNDLHIADFTSSGTDDFEHLPGLTPEKIEAFNLNPHVGVAKKGWEAGIFENEDSILSLLKRGIYSKNGPENPDDPISPIIERPDESVKGAFVLTCRKDPDNVSTKAQMALKKELETIAQNYSNRTTPLIDQHTQILAKFEALKNLPQSKANTAEITGLRSKLEFLEQRLLKEQKNLRKLRHKAWTEKFENTIFRHMIKSGNTSIGRMGLGLRHTENTTEIIGISGLVAAATAIISYSMIRLRQYYQEDIRHQSDLEKKATTPSVREKMVAQEDIDALSQTPEQPKFSAIQKSTSVTPKIPPDTAAGRVLEQRQAAESAGISL